MNVVDGDGTELELIACKDRLWARKKGMNSESSTEICRVKCLTDRIDCYDISDKKLCAMAIADWRSLCKHIAAKAVQALSEAGVGTDSDAPAATVIEILEVDEKKEQNNEGDES